MPRRHFWTLESTLLHSQHGPLGCFWSGWLLVSHTIPQTSSGAKTAARINFGGSSVGQGSSKGVQPHCQQASGPDTKPRLRPVCDYARNQAVAWLSNGYQADRCQFPVRAEAPGLGTGPPVLLGGQWTKPPLCCLLVCWTPSIHQHRYPTELEDFVTILWEERP